MHRRETGDLTQGMKYWISEVDGAGSVASVYPVTMTRNFNVLGILIAADVATPLLVP